MAACNLCGGTAFDAVVEKDGYRLVRCRACGLIAVANPPTEAELARLYSFESGYHTTLEVDPASTAFHQNEAVRNLRTLRGHVTSGRLLDIGCSTGLFLKAARASGWVGQGLEYSPDSSKIAREQNGLDVRTGALQPDTFAPDAFDVVTLWDVVEHLPDPSGTLALVAGILRPGGLLVLKTPNADGLFPRASLPLAGRLGFWSHAEPPGHLYQFSVATLSRMVERAGFEVVAVQHKRIPISYSFGTPRGWFRSAKWAAYCALFMPLALIGPWIGRGDDQVLVARRSSRS